MVTRRAKNLLIHAPGAACRYLTETAVLRAAGAAAFTSDPVRVLRAFRLSAKLNFSITKDTLNLMRIARGAISESSPERVLEKLLQILETRDVSPNLYFPAEPRQALPVALQQSRILLMGKSQ